MLRTIPRKFRRKLTPVNLLLFVGLCILLNHLFHIHRNAANVHARAENKPEQVSFSEKYGVYQDSGISDETSEKSPSLGIHKEEDIVAGGVAPGSGGHSHDQILGKRPEQELESHVHDLQELENRKGTVMPNGNKLVDMKAPVRTTAELERQSRMIKYLFKILQLTVHVKPKAGFEKRYGDDTDDDEEVKIDENGDPIEKVIDHYDGAIFPRDYGSSGIINVPLHAPENSFPILSEKILGDSLKVPIEIITELTKSHRYFVEHMPKKYPDQFYQGEGIVMIGGGRFSWLSLLSIENLRKTGSKLPVEVMIPTAKEFEHQLCLEILPTLNAKCILLYEVFPSLQQNKASSYLLSGYQLKSIALLVSSFEKVLLLDSDNTVVSNPDSLFHSEPFTSKGMIMWPDFWRRVTNPHFYEITRTELGKDRIRHGLDDVTDPAVYHDKDEDKFAMVDYPLHDRAGTIPDGCTESGQILINKRTHYQAILLSFYYNFYGPRHYYPLLSQGAKGEGDKETFLAACNYLDLPFYQVKKLVDVIGFWDKRSRRKESYNGVGMIQYDPATDWTNLHEFSEYDKARNLYIEEQKKSMFGRLKLWITKMDQYKETRFRDYFTKNNSQPLFIHSNFPKIDPVFLKKNNVLYFDGNVQNERIRMHQDQSGLDFDYELRQWLIIKKWFCEFRSAETGKQGIDLNYLRAERVDSADYCSFIKNELDFLVKTRKRIVYKKDEKNKKKNKKAKNKSKPNSNAKATTTSDNVIDDKILDDLL